MKISDELRILSDESDIDCGARVKLRKLADEAGIYSNTRTKLCELADRIDRETVELPRDKDGVPIHVWDTVYTEDGDAGNVIGIYFIQHKENVVCTLSDGSNIVCASHELSHEQPDSLGRIADELDEQAGSLTNDGYTWQEDAIHDFADRIRKLAAKDD